MKRKCTFPLQLWSFLVCHMKPQTSLCMLQYKTCVKEINSGRKTDNLITICKVTAERCIAFYWFLEKSVIYCYFIILLTWHPSPCFSQCQPSLKSSLIFWTCDKVNAKTELEPEWFEWRRKERLWLLFFFAENCCTEMHLWGCLHQVLNSLSTDPVEL